MKLGITYMAIWEIVHDSDIYGCVYLANLSVDYIFENVARSVPTAR